MFGHTALELLCSNETELPSPKSCAVLSHISINAILLCVWDASQLLRVKRAFPSIPWNWAGDNLSDRLLVLRVFFPPLDTGACSPNKLGEIVLLF